MDLFVVNVQGIDGNYKSVRNNSKNPKWAIKDKNCTKRVKETIEGGTCFFLFKPDQTSCKKYKVQHGFLGVAKIKGLVKREIGPLISLDETNEERGWEGEGYEYDVIFEKYWDLEKLYKSDVFSYVNITKFKALCGQLNMYDITKNNKELHSYLEPHINYCIYHLTPHYCINNS